MLLSITTTHQPATDLGYLLKKNPARTHEFETPYGKAYVFYTQASHECCTAVFMVDLDPVGLVRGKGEGEGVLSQYVNDRPFTASSFLTVAMTHVYRSAMAGNSKERSELAQMPIPLEAHLPVIHCAAGEDVIKRCFEPLGYTVNVTPIQQQDITTRTEIDSGYFALTVAGTVCLSDLLRHLYVLIPALDGHKHYYISAAEVENLLNKAKDWLAQHPERDWVISRYLKKQRSLVRQALEKLLEDSPDLLEKDNALSANDPQEDAEELAEGLTTDEGLVKEHSALPEKTVSLNVQRLKTVHEELVKAGVRTVADLGCGEGRLLRLLLKDRRFTKILGVDVSSAALEKAALRLKLDRLPPMQRERIEIVQGSLTYCDTRLKGFDVACVVEVIEHIDPERIAAFEQALFGFVQPPLVLLTSPNSEYNVKYEGMEKGSMRHRDHRFEWTRSEFEAWANHVCKTYGYCVEILPVGEIDEALGAPTQLGVFRK